MFSSNQPFNAADIAIVTIYVSDYLMIWMMLILVFNYC